MKVRSIALDYIIEILVGKPMVRLRARILSVNEPIANITVTIMYT